MSMMETAEKLEHLKALADSAHEFGGGPAYVQDLHPEVVELFLLSPLTRIGAALRSGDLG